ncbi:MAG: type II CRISPR-associated endonuclease Cas1 [Patescibacteria group bacterium]
MTWRVVDLMAFAGEVHTSRGRLVIDTIEVPLDEIGSVLIGTKTKFSGAMIQMCAKHEIPILTCDWRGLPLACTFPWSENSKIAARFRAQIESSVPKQKNAWMQVIKSKIKGQAQNLKFIGSPSAAKLFELADRVRSGDPENLEARAARTYWSSLYEAGTFSRNHEMQDGINSALNYGYAILRSNVVKAICQAGLNPTMGIFHRNRSNPFCLADDLMEPFRPAVDFISATDLINVVTLDRDSKSKLVEVLSLPMEKTGETVQTAILNLTSRLAIYFEGDTLKLDVPSWSPNHG